MPDTGLSVNQDAPQTEEQIQVANKLELDTMMKINLNGGIIPAEVLKTEVADQNPVITTDTPIPVTFETIKEKFSYQTAEDAIKEIEELRALKNNPPPPQEFKFENDESRKMAIALQKGDRKAVLDIWQKQEKLETLIAADVTKDNAAEIIKLAMKVENDDLTGAEIEFQYKEQYTPPKEPKEPIQKASEDEDDFKERHDEWKELHDEWATKVSNIETKISIAAKMAKPKLAAAKSKIVLPEIADTIDEGYIQYKKSLEDQPQISEAMKEIFKPFTSKSLETKIPFADETNKIGFEYQYEPDAESFNRSKEMAIDSTKFMDHFKTSDGKFDNLKYLRAIDLAINGDKYIIQAMTQAKNATIKTFIPDNNGGTQRQFPQDQGQGNEVDQMMQLHGIRKAV